MEAATQWPRPEWEPPTRPREYTAFVGAPGVEQSTACGTWRMSHRSLGRVFTIIGVWRSLVARLLWEQDVAGSNPVTPTNLVVFQRYSPIEEKP